MARTPPTDPTPQRPNRSRLLPDGGDDAPAGDDASPDDDAPAGDDRHMGVEFGELDDELDAVDYPVSLSELLDAHGDAELDLKGEKRSLAELLAPLESDTFESADEVRQSVLNMVDSEAIGRERYTDRGVGALDEGAGESADESF